MIINNPMITISQLIDTIETRQSVLNKEQIGEVQLCFQITGVASLDKAGLSNLTFLANAKFEGQLADTNAGVIIVDKKYEQNVPKTAVTLVVQSPYLAYASCSQLFDSINQQKPTKQNLSLIHESAVIADTAIIGENTCIAAYTVIGDGVQVGDNCHIANSVTIESYSVIGNDCVIKSNVVIAERTQIGHHARIHAGASIGSEGFGFAPTANPSQSVEGLAGWERIAQLGKVVIGNHVRIGANTTIDRGAIDDTIIEDNVIIDNLVQIAHNVRIGAGSAIAAKTGIAGSSTLGKRCIIGGAVGIVGHLQLCDDVTVTGMSMITKSITKSGSYSSGNSAMPSNEWRRAFVRLRQMGRK